MQPISTVPRADVARLPCVALMPGTMAKSTARCRASLASQEADAPGGQQPELYQAGRAFHAMLARLTGGISPMAVSLAYFDWAWRLAAALSDKWRFLRTHCGMRISFSSPHFIACCPVRSLVPDLGRSPQDRRFANSGWERLPFNLLAQAFLLNEQYRHTLRPVPRWHQYEKNRGLRRLQIHRHGPPRWADDTDRTFQERTSHA